MTIKTLRKPKLDPHTALIERLTDALLKAQEHLDYIDWGDPWQHELAEQNELPQKIADAIELGRVELNKQGITI